MELVQTSEGGGGGRPNPPTPPPPPAYGPDERLLDQLASPHARGNMRNTSDFTPKKLDEGRDCLRCGFRKYRTGEKCPAQGVICNSCGASNHFARVCIKSKRATVTHRKDVWSMQDGDDSEDREVNTVQIRTLRGQAARLKV